MAPSRTSHSAHEDEVRRGSTRELCKGAEALVQALVDRRDRGGREGVAAQFLGDGLDLPGRDPLHIHLRQRRHQRLLGALVWYKKLSGEAAIAVLRHKQIELAQRDDASAGGGSSRSGCWLSPSARRSRPRHARADPTRSGASCMTRACRISRRAKARNHARPSTSTGGVGEGVAILKDLVGVAQMLAIPTRRITGIEDPQMLAPDAPPVFADGWKAKALVEARLGRHVAARGDCAGDQLEMGPQPGTVACPCGLRGEARRSRARRLSSGV